MQVTQPGGQICNICKCRHLMVNFRTNASGATLWPHFERIQVVPLGGPIFKWCRWHHLVAKIATDAYNLVAKFVINASSAIESKSEIWNGYKFNSVNKITQVKDSIPWDRCASGKASKQLRETLWKENDLKKEPPPPPRVPWDQSFGNFLKNFIYLRQSINQHQNQLTSIRVNQHQPAISINHHQSAPINTSWHQSAFNS